MFLKSSVPKPIATFIFAHGAGAPMDSDWMNEISNYLNELDISVLRFEFPYMNERRLTGKKRPPNPSPLLETTWKEAISKAPGKNLFIGGKSMGGRIASLIADSEEKVKGLICLGFPFHAPGKAIGDKIKGLRVIAKPTLILQGERDPMGSLHEVNKLKLSPETYIHWLTDGDHSLKPRVASGKTLNENLRESAEQIYNFILSET